MIIKDDAGRIAFSVDDTNYIVQREITGDQGEMAALRWKLYIPVGAGPAALTFDTKEGLLEAVGKITEEYSKELEEML